jgi:probable rRNA maturation factor
MATLSLPIIHIDTTVQSPLIDFPSDWQEICKKIIALTLARVGLYGWYEASLVLTTDKIIQQINHKHRGIDRATDILSFPLSDTPLIDLSPEEEWTDHTWGDDTHNEPASSSINENDSETLDSYPIQIYGNQDLLYHLGDMIISIPTIERQSKAANHSIWKEFAFLVAHGTLHLVGYDDYYEQGYRSMVAHQEAILSLLRIT